MPAYISNNQLQNFHYLLNKSQEISIKNNLNTESFSLMKKRGNRNMKFIKTKNYSEMSKKAAGIIIKNILKKPDIVITLATGSTPKGLYKELVKAHKKTKIDFSKVKCFNLDEYYPIKKNNKNSFSNYLFKNLLNHINIQKPNINLLNGEAKNPKKECQDYEKKIKENPIDLTILGIGVNGHIAFNEPGSQGNSKTRLVNLKHKAPKKQALTMGIKTILSAKKIILLASEKSKAKAIKGLMKKKPNKNYPVSFLKKHKNITVIIDKKAASLL